jgi:hypothetical protein
MSAADISGYSRLKNRTAMFVFDPETAIAGLISWGWLVVLVASVIWVLGIAVIWVLSVRPDEERLQ